MLVASASVILREQCFFFQSYSSVIRVRRINCMVALSQKKKYATTVTRLLRRRCYSNVHRQRLKRSSRRRRVGFLSCRRSCGTPSSRRPCGSPQQQRNFAPLRVTDDILCFKQGSLYHSWLIASVAQLGSKVDKYIANESNIFNWACHCLGAFQFVSPVARWGDKLRNSNPLS